MRVSLRTLVTAFLLLCLSAPWWEATARRFSEWVWPPPRIVLDRQELYWFELQPTYNGTVSKPYSSIEAEEAEQ